MRLRLINSLTNRGNKSSPVNDILVNDRIVSDDKDISESFNDFFVNIGPTLATESTKRSSYNVNTHLRNDQNNFPPFRFSNIYTSGKCRVYAKMLKGIEKHWP